jgi:hypothetical protein
LDFSGLDSGCADALVAFASTVFLGVDLGDGFGGAFGFAVAFGTGVSIGVGFGNSISLFAWVNGGFSCSFSSGLKGSGSTDGVEIFVASGSLLSGFPAVRSSAPLSQTRLSASGELRAAELH